MEKIVSRSDSWRLFLTIKTVFTDDNLTIFNYNLKHFVYERASHFFIFLAAALGGKEIYHSLKCLSSRALNYGRNVFSRTCREYRHFPYRSTLKTNVDTSDDNKISNIILCFLFSSLLLLLLVWPNASCIRGHTRFIELHTSHTHFIVINSSSIFTRHYLLNIHCKKKFP